MQVQDAVDGSEFPGHVRDHHMLELELRRRMNAIDCPGAGGSLALNQGGVHFILLLLSRFNDCSDVIHANGQSGRARRWG